MTRYRFCPRCGARTAPRLEEARERDHCAACDRTWYDFAKPCATALVIDPQGRVLLVRRAVEPYRGKWNLPGGFLEADEHPTAGAVRETLEETGFTIALGAFLGAYLDHWEDARDPTRAHHSLSLAYLARVVGGSYAPNHESGEAGWFAPDALPAADDIAYDNHRRALADWAATARLV